MGDIIRYLIEFLLYGNKDAIQWVGYTAEEKNWHQYKVVIIPCGALGNRLVMPDLSSPQVETHTWDHEGQHGTTYLIRTDLIYNAFFFISRAEEILCSERDEHDRFLARHSVLGTDNRLQIPLIDEYGHLLLKLLQLPTPAQQLSAVYLTHDIDTLARYRHLRGALGGLRRGEGKQVWKALQNIYDDPEYTFPWLIKQDAFLRDTSFPVYQLYFAKDTFGSGFDYPQYNLDGYDFQYLAHRLNKSGAQIGWHSSYYRHLPRHNNPAINYSLHRSHYLRCSIDFMEQISHQGVMQDFSMGFADQAGFRLQTTRPVRWINPYTYELTSLVLHPLTAMDVTFSAPHYMGLDEDEAYFLCQRLIDKTRQVGGEVVLLWHNSNVQRNSYHRRLYPTLLDYLKGQ